MRALAWSCFSTPLINAPLLPLTPERQRWLNALDRDDRALREHLELHCKSPRLGLVFESLWHFFLSQDSETTLLSHNLPVRRTDGRTLGEFDILYRHHGLQKTIHLELAVKFFLATRPGTLPLSGWLGPNSADRLDRKLARLHSHQLRLSATPEGQQRLADEGIGPCEARLHVAGMLFFPDGVPATSPELNPKHPRGLWLHRSEFLRRYPSQAQREQWRLLEKPHWLSADYHGAKTLEQGLELAKSRPQMLINPQHQRCFIVPQSWPEKPSP